MNKNGRGLAIAGIWIGMAIASFSPAVAGSGIVSLAVAAAFATISVAMFF